MYKILFDKLDYNKSSVIFSCAKFPSCRAHKLPEVQYMNIEFVGQPSGQFDFREEKNIGIVGDVSKANIFLNSHADFVRLGCIGGIKGIRGDIDLSGVDKISISGNLSEANIKFNPNAQFIELHNVIGLRGYFDFSHVQVLDIADFFPAELDTLQDIDGIKFNPQGFVFGISDAKRRLLESAYKKHERNH